jgi:hypothetical protein
VVLYYCTRKQYGRVAPLPLTATPMHLRGGLPVPCSHLSRALCPVRVSIHAIWDCLPSTTTAGRSWLWLAGVSPQPSGIINSSPLVDRSRAARTEDLALSPRAAGKKIKKAPGACICNGHRSSLPVASPPADERDAHETKKIKKRHRRDRDRPFRPVPGVLQRGARLLVAAFRTVAISLWFLNLGEQM